MRPRVSSPSTVAAGGSASSSWRWNSPMPYLYGGMGFLMGLIAVALIVLACHNRRSRCHASSSSSHRDGSAGERATAVPAPLDMEPRVVVIMPEEAIPRFLAKAAPSATQSSQQ